jgi:hypothetical protein
MLKNTPVIALLLVSTLIGASFIPLKAQNGGYFEITRIYPPVYYGSTENPVSGFYVNLKIKQTGEHFDKVFIAQTCSDDYKKVQLRQTVNTLITTYTNIYKQTNTADAKLTKTLCPSNPD